MLMFGKLSPKCPATQSLNIRSLVDDETDGHFLFWGRFGFVSWCDGPNPRLSCLCACGASIIWGTCVYVRSIGRAAGMRTALETDWFLCVCVWMLPLLSCAAQYNYNDTSVWCDLTLLIIRCPPSADTPQVHVPKGFGEQTCWNSALIPCVFSPLETPFHPLSSTFCCSWVEKVEIMAAFRKSRQARRDQ